MAARLANHRIMMVIVFAATFVASPVFAVDFGTWVRKLSKVADDVPLKHLDNVVQDGTKSQAAAKNILAKRFNRTDVLADDELYKLSRKALQTSLDKADDPLLKSLKNLDDLDDPGCVTALVLMEGATTIKKGVPDVAARSRFIKEGGAKTVAVLGRYNDLLDDALKFDIAVKAGKLPSPTGIPKASLENFGEFFQSQGDRGHYFWMKYVRPNWKLWAGSAALVAILASPEEYLDEVGNVTKAGIKKIAAFGGDVLGKTVEGVVEGTGDAIEEVVRKTTTAFYLQFFTSVSGVIALVVLVLIVVVAMPFTRYWALRSIQRVFTRKPVLDRKRSSK